MNATPFTVVIVGAGFCGTTLAVNLLQEARGRALRIVLIDRQQMARGLAYARRPYPYLLNVPAGRMSATADSAEFLRFARQSRPNATAEDFLPRELYGDYLEWSLAVAEGAAQGARLERIYGSVIAIERMHRSSGTEVRLSDGRTISGDVAVLALGNPPPAPLPALQELADSARCETDPWEGASTVLPGETVFVLGTGLTMVDTLLAVHAATGGRITAHAISRRGLLPPPQRPLRESRDEHDSTPLLRAASISARQLMRAVRALAAEIQSRHGDWREAVAHVRAIAPALWRRLSLPERRRFLRHARPYWDVHRHRLPESTWSALHELRSTGVLNVQAGRLVKLEPSGKRVRVTWRARGAAELTMLTVDRVINCTGPDYDARRTREPLLRSMLAQGVAVADPLGLGVVTDERGGLIAVTGRAPGNLYYLGPMSRGSQWETTAVPELREQAMRLTQHLLLAQRACEGPVWTPPRRAAGGCARPVLAAE